MRICHTFQLQLQQAKVNCIFPVTKQFDDLFATLIETLNTYSARQVIHHWTLFTLNNRVSFTGLFLISEKDGTKAVNLTYKDKLQFVAYTRQVAHGKYRPDVSPDVGFLDVVGNDRRWVLSI